MRTVEKHGISALILVLLFTLQVSGQSWIQLGADIDGEAADDHSGESISISADGNRVAIGAPYNDGNGASSGHVRVFESSGGSWIQLGNDIDGEAAGDESGHHTSVSLSADGSRVAVGALFNSATAAGSGHVRIFEYSGGNWIQLGDDIDGDQDYDLSGVSVSLSSDGNIVAIGAPGAGVSAGYIRVLEYSGGSWIQQGGDIVGVSSDFSVGDTVSLSADGSRVAVSALNSIVGYSSSVRIFEYSGGNWVQLGAVLSGEAADDYFGWGLSMSADGSRVAIGAQNASGSGIGSGDVRIFEYSGGNWVQLGADIDGEAAGDQSGGSVSLNSDGSLVAIGARDNGDNGDYSGQVRIFQFSGGNWNQLGADIDGEAEVDINGSSVSLSADGSRVAMGAPLNDGNGVNSGHARIFELYVPIPDDTDGDGIPDVIELAFGGDISNRNDADNTIGYITNNTLLTIDQVQDLRAGSSMIEVSGGAASISFNIEASSNLVDWVELTNTTSAVIPADSDTRFFRFRMD